METIIEIDGEDVELIRAKILKIKKELLDGEWSSFNRAYLLGLKHTVPYSLKEQDIHLKNLCDEVC